MGDNFYRYSEQIVSNGVDEYDESLGSHMELYCYTYRVEKITPKGARIADWSLGGTRPVMDMTINKFAYPTKAEALLGFIARKRRQQSILNGQFARSKEAQMKADRLLAKELSCLG